MLFKLACGLLPAALVLAAAGLAGGQSASGQVPATHTDNAGHYTGYVSGSGADIPGFGPFNITAADGAGTFVFTAKEGEGNNGTPAPVSIDTAGKSFGLYSGGTPKQAVAVMRSFAAGLQKRGDSFSLDFVTGYNDGKNADGSAGGGKAGVELLSGATPVGSFFYQSNDQYLFDGKAIAGQQYTNGALHLTYTLTSPTTYSLTVAGAVSYTGTGTFSGPITGFEVQQVNSGSGMHDHNAYFNNLSVMN